ncbi:TonB-dependent receptor domain-containing protein [Taklimakanibacter lacteus]|uniref:TonB-dependent receptor domain-containing protein n=1 Tax=Taklimakanibacter lacteus TaxID=2268456 RepID=UPI0013C50392
MFITSRRGEIARALSLTTAAMALVAAASMAHGQESEQDSAAAQEADGGVLLDPIVIRAKKEGDENYRTPASVTTVTPEELKRESASRADDILRTIPGVSAQSQQNSPGMSVNIRGMQDFGRVNVMIDGARQTFQFSGHGPNGTVFVDPALIRSVDVAKGFVATEGGAGAIGGAVNFRTLELEDILTEGKSYGAETTVVYGTNGYNWSEVLSAGVKDERFRLFGAVSNRDSDNYKDGDVWWEEPMEIPQTWQKTKSALAKFGMALTQDQQLDVGLVAYDSKFAKASADYKVNVLTTTAKYHYDPASELVDLKVNGFYNQTDLKQDFFAFITGEKIHYNTDTVGLDGSNTSRFRLGAFDIAARYGAEGFYDWVKTEDEGSDQTAPGLTPEGERGVGGLFSEVTASWKLLELIGGLRVDHYSLTGKGVNDVTGGGGQPNPSLPGIPDVPVGPFEVDKSETAVSPKFTAAVTPFDWMQLYALYGWGFRPPAITEVLTAGQHPGGPGGFVKFFPNPFLDPERSQGWEVGANIAIDDVFGEASKVRIKASYFSNEVEDYIVGVGGLCGFRLCYFYVNADGVSKVEGFEVEASLDLGYFFAGLGYHDIKTDIATAQLPGLGYLSYQPEEVWTLTGGIRLFEERFTIGGRIRDISETLNYKSFDPTIPDTYYPAYRLYDLFASAKVNDHLDVFLNADNITNVKYVPAMTTDNVNGPGTTIKIGVSARL